MAGARMRRAFGRAAAAGVAVAIVAVPAGASERAVLPAPLRTWVANGPILGLGELGGAIVVGGRFDRIGSRTGSAVILSTASAKVAGRFPEVAGGSVDTAIADGHGGWYLGGRFRWVGGLRRNGLAHVLSSGTVDPAFDPVAVDEEGTFVYPGAVTNLVLAAGRLFAAGTFNRIGGEAREGLAALDPGTGKAAEWDAHIEGYVRALAATDEALIVAGGFLEIGGAERRGLAALDLRTGGATAWRPEVDGGVEAVAVSPGAVYLGGAFTRVAGAARTNLAAVDSATGAPLPWAPVPPGPVRSLALDSRRVFAGTRPKDQNAAAGSGVTAFARESGQRAWGVPTDGSVRALLPSGDALYAAGAFRRAGGADRSGVAVLDAATGRLRPWAPAIDLFATTLDFDRGAVQALAEAGRGIVVGGDFASIGGVRRDGLAALDPTTGRPLPWHPRLDGPVTALTVGRGRIYAVGTFRRADGRDRNGGAAWDSAFRLTPWKILPLDPGPATGVTIVGRLVLLTGHFNEVEPRKRHGSLAAFDADTGAFVDWGPPDLVGNGVFQVLAGGGRVYAVGVSGISSTIVLLDPKTGRVKRYLVDNEGTGDIYAAALRGRTLFVGGAVQKINGTQVKRIAAIDAVTGKLLPWRQTVSENVFSLAVAGDVLYVAGQFTAVDDDTRVGLVALDARDGRVLPWDPDAAGYSGRVGVIGKSVYVLGGWLGIGGRAQPFAALVPPATARRP